MASSAPSSSNSEYGAAASNSFRKRIAFYVYPQSYAFLPLLSYISLLPPIFALRFHARRIWFRLTGRKLTQMAADGSELHSSFVGLKALPYNLANQFVINRDRTERLIVVLRAIRDFDISVARILVVGPRNEAELLLLRSYGMNSARIEAIDLFSYAPTIKLMDMHRLEFEDDIFDCYYSAYVITYSDDIQRAVDEAIRVCRDGAVLVFAFESLKENVVNKLGVRHLGGGAEALCAFFGEHVDKIYWQEDAELERSFRSSIIFRLKKNAAIRKG